MIDYTCSICLKDFEGWGNNAEPLRSGRCCDDCNKNVIHHRYLRLVGVIR